MSIDSQQIKAQIDWNTALPSITGLPPETFNGKHQPCPKCRGTDRFRSFNDGTGGAICNRCFKEKNGDGFSFLQWYFDESFPDALKRAAGYLDMAVNGNRRSNDNGNPTPGIFEKVWRAKSIPPDSLRCYGGVEAKRLSKKGKPFDVVRVPFYDADFKRISHFDLVDWGKGLAAKGGNVGLFLPIDRKPQAGETWLITEGVKDAAALHSLGYLAAGIPCNQMAAQFARAFQGCRTVLVPDLDAPSFAGVELTASRLWGVTKSIETVRLPGELKPSGGDDVRDVLRVFGADAVHDAVKTATKWNPPKPADDRNEMFQLLNPENLTEVANAGRLISKSPFPVRWCDVWKKWLWWNGQVWQFDDMCVVDSLARDVCRDLWANANSLKRSLTGTESDNVKKVMSPIYAFARHSSDLKGIRATTALARSEPNIPIEHEAFDADPLVLNLANGVLELKDEFSVRPHDPAFYQTRFAPVAFDSDAKCPRWMRFMFQIMAERQDLVDYVQRLVGYTLTGLSNEHILPLLYGTGANGKSVFLNTLYAMMGDYAMKAPHDLLMSKGKATHPTERAALFGKRFVAANEVNEGRRLDEALVKELTGGDPITARRMREDFWTFDPTHTIWLAANHKPTVTGTDDGIWRRIRLIPFTVSFQGSDADPHLPEKLLAELPGILNWAIEGCRLWTESGFGEEPELVRVATNEYRNESDILAQFIGDCCVASPEKEVYSTPLYKGYVNWAESHGEKPMSQTKFGARLTDSGFPSKPGSRNRKKRVGLTLLAEHDPDFDSAMS